MKKRSSRRTNEGSVYFCEANGYWMAQLTLAYDPATGKRKRLSRYAKTKREALEKLQELRDKYSYNIHFDADKITVKQWLDKWFETYKKPKLRENTLVSYKRILDICCESIGYMKLEKVQPSDLQYIIYNVIGSDHYRSCQYFRTVIKQAFARAVVENLLIKSPADNLELPKKPPKKPFVKPTAEDWQTLLDADVGFYGWRLAILTVLVTGARRSEVLGLTWDSFQFEYKDGKIISGKVVINKGLAIGDVDPATKRHRLYIGPTKSESGMRTLPLPMYYINELMAYKKEQNIRRLASKKWEHPEMIFTTNDGRYYNPDVFSSLYSRVCREKEIKTTFHQLRHDMATSMKSSHEFDFKDIQHQLGHSNIQITLDTYTHMEEKDLDRMKDWVEKRIKIIH